MLLNIHLSMHGDGKWKKVYSKADAFDNRVSARIEANYQGYRSVFMLVFGIPVPVVFDYQQRRTTR